MTTHAYILTENTGLSDREITAVEGLPRPSIRLPRRLTSCLQLLRQPMARPPSLRPCLMKTFSQRGYPNRHEPLA